MRKLLIFKVELLSAADSRRKCLSSYCHLMAQEMKFALLTACPFCVGWQPGKSRGEQSRNELGIFMDLSSLPTALTWNLSCFLAGPGLPNSLHTQIFTPQPLLPLWRFPVPSNCSDLWGLQPDNFSQVFAQHMSFSSHLPEGWVRWNSQWDG